MRRPIHRYPHKIHQRRATEHSFADQGPTHYGRQQPILEEADEDFMQHSPLHAAPQRPVPHATTGLADKTEQVAPQAPIKGRHRPFQLNRDYDESSSTSSSEFYDSEDDDYTSSEGFYSEDFGDRYHQHRLYGHYQH